VGEYAIAEHIRDILVQEQDHQIALSTALGVETPNVAKGPEPSNGAAKKEHRPLTTAHS